VFKEDDDADLFAAAEDLDREDVVVVTGTVQAADQAPGGAEIAPTEMEVLSEAETPLPLEISKDVDADLSTRLDLRYMDVRAPEVKAIFSLRSKAMAAMREWFEDAEFEEVDTPLLSAAGAEGGADLFPVVYYDKEAFLSQSPQLYKQMLVASGFDRLYEVGHAFRAEDFATSRHVSEIAMFDVEIGYIEDHHDVMDVQEESLRHVIRRVVETAERELDLLGSDLTVPEEPFPRISFDEALDILETEYGHFPEDPGDLDTKGEKLLGEHFAEQGHPAIFVVGYPGEKFYYWQREGDDLASRKFDLLYRGQELSSGGQREHDREKLVAAMEAGGVDPADFEFYLDAFRYGVPPHGGYGLGIDRMIQQLAGLDNIKEAILFPRDPDRLEP
jgi:aspartyl-tRNA synthetase